MNEPQSRSPETPADARGLSPVIQARPIWHWVLLTLCSFGFYLLYWNWMAWSYLRDRHGARVMPLVRAAVDVLLLPVFVFPLYRDLIAAARARGYPEAPPAPLLAVAHVGFWAMGAQSVLLSLLRPFLQVLPLLPVFEAANFLWRSEWPHAPERRGFSTGELLLVGFGAFMWANVVYTVVFHPEAVREIEAMLGR